MEFQSPLRFTRHNSHQVNGAFQILYGTTYTPAAVIILVVSLTKRRRDGKVGRSFCWLPKFWKILACIEADFVITGYFCIIFEIYMIDTLSHRSMNECSA